NELALQLLLGIIALLFSLFRGGIFAKVISSCAIPLSSAYMLKSGSRGIFLTALATAVIAVFLSRRKARIAVSLLLLSVVVVLFLPADTFHRLTYVATGPQNVTVASEDDLSSISSQLQRERLFFSSIKLTFQHPIFGVGPGQFTAKSSNEQGKRGEAA